jgi:hypothetical protein
MNASARQARLVALIAALAILVVGIGCVDPLARQAAIDKARAQTARLAEQLDQKTTETGTYIRVKDGEIQENDPWGTRITVVYSQGGIAETISVRSAGPDREFHTDDDITANAVSANLKGVGAGIKEHAGEVAASAAEGVVRGTVKGIKESIKEALPKRKDKPGNDKAPSGENNADAANESP